MNLFSEFTKGLYRENPVFRIVLGLCPVLAVTKYVKNAFGMGIAVIAVLVCSNLIISLFRNLVPQQIRIPIYIAVIATFVTITEMLMAAYQPALYKALGIFVPLIVVNCVILGRAEAYASKNSIIPSIMDGLGMGIGYTLSLILISSIRELLGFGSLFNVPIFPQAYKPIQVMVAAPGAFLTLGLMLGLSNWLNTLRKRS
jgi:Na+-translocating ferredoxin:NAD+ oxidoreductase subunit E